MAAKRKPRRKTSKAPVTQEVAGATEVPQEEPQKVYPRGRRITAQGYGKIRDGYDARPTGYGRQTYH